ncbi:ATP-binding protein [Spirosoma litoris]
MSIKSKIGAALGFMFAIILAIGGLGIYYLNELSNDTQAILKDNYISLEYTSSMQKALAMLTELPKPDPEAITDFERNLKKQAGNLTEVGEQELTGNLQREFKRLRTGAVDSATLFRLRQNLFALDDINRQAIIRKNEQAKQTAKDALLWLSVVGTSCFLILFSFVLNIPGYIANPLRELTQGLRQVTKRNFEERLHINSSDEFGELARTFNSMAQKLDEYEHSNLASVLFEKRRIDTLIRIMSEGIVGMDENKRILFANPVACRLLGIDEAHLLGHYAPDIAASNDLMRTLIQDIMTEKPVNSEQNGFLKIYDPRPGGTGLEESGKESYFNRRTHTVEVVPTGEDQPQLAGYVMVLENITPYKELDLAKTNFIATISHELKTPLSSSKMSLKLLEDSRIGELNDEQKQLVGNVRADINRLLNLTGELLNMAQVESGQIQLNIQAVAPTDIVKYATNALRVQAENKRITLKLDVGAGLPPVAADPDKASWVLVNFLSNAIRHSREDSTIDVSAELIDSTVEFRVRDYGPGIRPEHRDRVFDRYFKAHTMSDYQLNGKTGGALSGEALTGEPSSSGTGLGLAISSEFIQSMKGQIGLDKAITNGAAFYFRLPFFRQD